MAKDDAETFARVLAAGPGFYEQLETDWRAEYAEELEAVDGNLYELEDLDDLEYPDGARRAQIVRDHLATLASGGEPEPLVCDLHGFSGGIHLMDGYHRLAALGIAEHPTVSFYQLLPE